MPIRVLSHNLTSSTKSFDLLFCSPPAALVLLDQTAVDESGSLPTMALFMSGPACIDQVLSNYDSIKKPSLMSVGCTGTGWLYWL